MYFTIYSPQLVFMLPKFAETKSFGNMGALIILLKQRFIQLSKSIAKAIFVKGI